MYAGEMVLSHKFIEVFHTDGRRRAEGDPQQVAQGGRSLHRVLCVRHIDDEHQVDVPEQGVAALEFSAVLFDQRHALLGAFRTDALNGFHRILAKQEIGGHLNLAFLSRYGSIKLRINYQD